MQTSASVLFAHKKSLHSVSPYVREDSVVISGYKALGMGMVELKDSAPHMLDHGVGNHSV